MNGTVEIGGRPRRARRRRPRAQAAPGARPIRRRSRRAAATYSRTVEGDLRGDRIFHRIFGRRRPPACPRRCGGPGPACPSCENRRRGLRARTVAVGAHAHQIGIAGAEAAADDASHRYSLRLASALTAATVIAEPPRRPSTVSAGTGGSAISAALDSAAPTKPTDSR